MLETFILSITSFIGTNMDDMIINMFFFSWVTGKREVQHIVMGKYFGIGILMLLSFIGALGLQFIPIECMRYLGLIPIGLGLKEFIHGNKEEKEEHRYISDTNTTNLLWNVAVVTIANGADNIGVYIPLFTGFTGIQYLLCIAVFIFMTAVWCALGYRMSKIPVYEKMIHKHRKIIVPLTYIFLGLSILI